MSQLLLLLKPFYLPILKWSGIALGLFLAWFKIHHDGVKDEKAKEAVQTLKDVETREKIEQTISGLSDDKLNKLYDKDTK